MRKVAPISEPLDRPSLEEIKLQSERDLEDLVSVHGGLIPMDDSFYDFWGKRKTVLKKRGTS